jgi:hypothetical protein
MWERMARELGLRGSAPEPMRMGALAVVGAEICTRRVFGRVASGRVGVRERGKSKNKCGGTGEKPRTPGRGGL